MEKAPHKKDELTIANHVLKLASKLLKVTLNLRQEIVLCIFFALFHGFNCEDTLSRNDASYSRNKAVFVGFRIEVKLPYWRQWRLVKISRSVFSPKRAQDI